MNLSLEEWDYLVGRHLHLIEAGADMVLRHAKDLLGAPEWETQAADRINEAEKVLVMALARLHQGRELIKAKPRVS